MSARAAAGESEPDDAEGLAVVVAMAQQHYTHKEACGEVVRELSVGFAPSVREARAALADANAALPRCSDDNETEPELLTVRQAAKRFNIGERTVYRLIENGLPVSRVGRAVRIKPSDLAKRLQDQGTKLR